MNAAVPPFKRFTRRLRLLHWAILGLMGVGLATWALWPSADPKTELQTARVETGTVEEFVTAQGKLEPKEYVDVGTQVSGQLLKLHVELGDDVSQGDLLAEIDPTVYQSRVEADKAQLANLAAQLNDRQASLQLAKQLHQRNQELVKTTAISKQEADNSAAALKSAQASADAVRAQIRQAQSTLQGDQANLGYTKIYAPISGTVVAQAAREGQTVNASQSAPTIVQVANLDVMTVRAQVAEADVMRVREGMPVHFTTLGAMDKKWRGTVRQVLPSPEVVNDVVLYNVLIDADNTDRQLMTGMSTQVFFEIGKAENVPVIPVAALGRMVSSNDASGTQVYRVRVKSGRTIQPTEIEVGLMDRTKAEVKKGLKVGDEIVTGEGAATAAPSGGQGGNRGGSGMRGMGGPRL